MAEFSKDNPGIVFEVVVQRQVTQEKRINVTASNAKEALDTVKSMAKIHDKNGWTALAGTGEPEIVSHEDKGPVEYKRRRLRGREQWFSTGRPAD